MICTSPSTSAWFTPANRRLTTGPHAHASRACTPEAEHIITRFFSDLLAGGCSIEPARYGLGRLAKIQLHRNGLLALAGVALLVALVGVVWTVAALRVISVVIALVAFVEIVVHLVRRRELWTHSRLFDSQSTFNPPTRKPRKEP
jgi:hypothetical protein